MIEDSHTNPTQREANLKAYSAHVRFWEKHEGWPPVTDEEIEASYNRFLAKEAARVERLRLRGTLHGAPISKSTQERLLPGSVPLP